MKLVVSILLLTATPALAGGVLSEDFRISSKTLGYDVQYRVYVPQGAGPAENLPVIFTTDGYWFVKALHMPKVLDRVIESNSISPVVAVFVDARDPDNLQVNRRNHEFYCNPQYLQFFVDELIPTIEEAYPVQRVRDARTIIGLSFGGLNAACFGLLGYETFSGIGMLSPATHPVQTLLPTYEAAPKLPLRIFLSTGWPGDNTATNRKFRKILKKKGYEMEFIQTRSGHDWDNWRPLIDDVLRFFYGAASEE